MRIIPNQSDNRFVSRLMRNGQKSIRFNPINSETSIWMNPNQSETKFSIQINPRSDSFGLILFENSVWINPSSDWFGLISIENLVLDWFRFIRIDVSELIGLLDWFLTVFWIISEWFALARIQISEWIGIVLIDPEWISIQY